MSLSAWNTTYYKSGDAARRLIGYPTVLVASFSSLGHPCSIGQLTATRGGKFWSPYNQSSFFANKLLTYTNLMDCDSWLYQLNLQATIPSVSFLSAQVKVILQSH